MKDIQSKRFNHAPFEGSFLEALGKPELKGSWIIWGPPKNGKTRFVLQLCKYLTRFGKVAYDSLEEGFCLSMQVAFIEAGMIEYNGKIVLLDKEPIIDLKERLRRQRSPQIIVIDSIQYSRMKYAEYISLKEEFPNKLFIFISHAEGKEPAGRVAKQVRYDAFIAIRVEGFRAFPFGRYGGGKPYDIWPEKAKEIYGE